MILSLSTSTLITGGSTRGEVSIRAESYVKDWMTCLQFNDLQRRNRTN